MKLTFGSLVEAVKQAKMFTDNWYFAEKGTIIDYNTLLQMAEYNDAHHIPGEYYFIDGLGSIGQLIGTQEVIVFKGQPRTIYTGNINGFSLNQPNQSMNNKYGVAGHGIQEDMGVNGRPSSIAQNSHRYSISPNQGGTALKFCPNCGASVYPDSNFCEECGYKLR